MGTENSLLLSYFSIFALSKPKSYITPNFKKSNQNLMLPKYLNKNQSNQISQNQFIFKPIPRSKKIKIKN